ncbi:MAG: hypothetical protein SNG02_06045 [Rikenellaceae bacterium]
MTHIGKIIEAELKRQRRSVTWLAQQLYCDRTNVYSIFKRQSLDTKLLFRISLLLKCDFFKEYSALYKTEMKQILRCHRKIKPLVGEDQEGAKPPIEEEVVG